MDIIYTKTIVLSLNSLNLSFFIASSGILLTRLVSRPFNFYIPSGIFLYDNPEKSVITKWSEH